MATVNCTRTKRRSARQDLSALGLDSFCPLPLEAQVFHASTSMALKKPQKPVPEIDCGEGRRGRKKISAMYSLPPGSNYQPEKKRLVLRSLQCLCMCVRPPWSPSSRYGAASLGRGPPARPETSPPEHRTWLYLAKALPHSVTSP